MAGFMKRLFRGADTPAEEKAEARAVRSGKITPKQYVAGEKSEGEKEPGMMARAKALKSGKMSPAAYAKHEQKEKAMKCGGKVKKMAVGGATAAAVNAARAGVQDKLAAAQSQMGNAAGKMQAAQLNMAPKPAPVLSPAAKAQNAAKSAMQIQAAQAGARANAVRGALGTTGGGKPAPVGVLSRAKGGGVEAKGKTAGKAVKMAKGGSARGCGIAVKGKTKGKMV